MGASTLGVMTDPVPGAESVARADQTHAGLTQAWRTLVVATAEDIIPATPDPMRQWATLCRQILAQRPYSGQPTPAEVHFVGLLAAGAVDVARSLAARQPPPATSDNGLSAP